MKIGIIAVKELKEVSRGTGGLLYMFLMPVAFLIVFNLIFGGAFSTPTDRPFPVPLSNQDRGDLAEKVIKQLESLEWVRVERAFEDGRKYSENDVIDFVQNGRRNQALIFPPDFTEKIRAGKEIKVPLYIDPAVAVQYIGPVEGSITGAMYAVIGQEQIVQQLPGKIKSGMQDFEEDLGILIPPNIKEKMYSEKAIENFVANANLESLFTIDGSSLLVTLDKKQPPAIKREEFPTVYQQNLSGYSVMAIFFIITAIGAAFFDEKEHGTFRRILAAPVHRASFLVGKLLPYVFINFLQVAVLIVLSIIIYNTHLGSSPLALFCITLCMSVSASGLGLMMVSLFRSRQKMEAVSVVVVLMATALSGAFVPRFIMGELVQNISLAVPQSWGLMAYQDIMVRGKGLIDVLPHCGILLAFAAGFFLIGIFRHRFE